jgi:putative copper resistance protein D
MTTGRVVSAWLAVVAVTAGLLAAFAPSLALLYGLPPAGTLVTFGLPAARLLAVGAAAGGIGQLLVAAVLVPGEPGDVVSAAGYRGLRAARWCALTEGAAGLVVAALTVVENSGLATNRLIGSGSALLVGLEQIEPAAGWVVTGALALLLAALAGWVLTWRGSVGLLLLAILTPLPAALTAATDAQRSHDIAGDALAVHVLASLLWLGSASAVALHLARSGKAGDVVLRRHTVLATWSLVAVGASGLISSAYAVPAARLLTSGFGLLVVVSAALLAALALLGGRLRRAVLGPDGRDRGRAVRLVVAELALLAGAAALGTGLTRLVPPAELGYVTSRYVYLIGYDLPSRFHLVDLVWRWRPDLVFGPSAVLAAVVYLLGLRRLRRAGRQWPRRYTAAWLCGCATLLVATSSGVGLYAPALFSVHMAQHMLLATLVPALLVLGHGTTLATGALAPGTARRLVDLLDSSLIGFLSHPLVAWTAVGVTLFGLYPTGLYAAILQQHWAHLAMDVAFLGTGLALFRSILGATLGRRALPPIGQLVMVFAVMALHAAFAAWLLGQPTAVAGEFYRSLRLSFAADPLTDQRLGAILAWILGELPVILTVIALVRRWIRDDTTTTSDTATCLPAGHASPPLSAVPPVVGTPWSR